MPPKKKSKTKPAATQKLDDDRLWQAVTKSVTPLKSKGRVTSRPSTTATKADTAPPPASQNPPAQRNRPGTKPTSIAAGTRHKTPKTDPVPKPMDRRQVRRVVTGKQAIDATLDLHGMTQAEAYSALRAFVLASAGQRLRLLLVVTGKGGVADATDEGAIVSERRKTGVLRRAVPHWLDTDPELEPLVIGHMPAHVRHGGQGALYVRLRAKTATKKR